MYHKISEHKQDPLCWPLICGEPRLMMVNSMRVRQIGATLIL